jgi:hypothetical protein
VAQAAGDWCIWHDRRIGSGREDQLVLCQSRATADAFGPGHRRSRLEWKVLFRAHAIDFDEALSDRVGGSNNHSYSTLESRRRTLS